MLLKFNALPIFKQNSLNAVPNLPRAMQPCELAGKLKKYTDDVIYYDDLTEGFRAAEESLDKDEVLVIFGSLYLAGAVRSIIRPVR